MNSTLSFGRNPVLRRLGLSLLLAAAAGCNNTAPNQVSPSVTITKPTANEVITATDDEDPTTPGIQFSIVANVTNLNSGSNAALKIDGLAVGSTQQVTTTKGAGTVTFSKVTLAPGTQSISVEVTDKVSGAPAADTKTVTVEAAGPCSFTAPGAALSTTTTTVSVVCPNLPDGSPVSLTIQAPVALGGYVSPPITGTYLAGGGGAVFTNVQLQNGAQTLNFTGSPAGGNPQTASENVVVSAGGCGVWPSQKAYQIYNAFGEAVDGGTTTPIASVDAGSPVELVNLQAYVDSQACPVGTMVSLSFGNGTVATSIVGSLGAANFSDVPVPNGDPTTEVITAAATGSTSFPVPMRVDSIIPTLDITSPSEAQVFAAGSAVPVKVQTTGVDSNGVTLLVDGAGVQTTAGAAGEYDTTLHPANGGHNLEATTARALGNTGRSTTVGITVGTSTTCINVISPTFTTCNHANDANPATPDCDLTFAVSVCPAVTHVVFGVENGGPGLTGAGPDGGLNVPVADGGASAVYALPQGPSVITATAYDAAGDHTSIPLGMTVGTIPPTLYFIYPDAGALLTSQLQNVVVGWTGPVVGQVIGDISLSEGGVTLGNQLPANSVDGGAGTATIAVNLPVGINETITASASDIYNNPATVSEPVTVNTNTCDLTLTSPSVLNPIFGLAQTTDAGASRDITLVGNTTQCKGQVVTITKSLAMGTLTQTLGSVTTDPNTGDFTFPAPVSDGDYGDQLILTIGSGTKLHTLTLTYDADFTPPVLTSVVPALGSLTIVTPTDPRHSMPGFIASTDVDTDGGAYGFTVMFTGAGTPFDAGQGSFMVAVVGDGGQIFDSVTGITNNTMTENVSGNVQVPVGFNGAVAVTATDEAGNQASGTWSLTVDLSGSTATNSSSSSSSSSGSVTGSTGSTSSGSTGSSSGSTASTSSSSGTVVTSSTSSSSSGSVSTDGGPFSLVIDQPAGTITLADDHGGDRATYAALPTTVSWSYAQPSGTTVAVCSTIGLGASPSPCPATVSGSTYFLVPSAASASGTFESFGSLHYAEGQQQIIAVLVAGSTTIVSAPVALNVATVPPVVTSVSIVQDPDAGALSSVNWPSGTSIQVNASITGSVDGGTATLEDIQGATTSTLTTAAVVNGSVQFTVSSIADGTYTLKVLAQDAVGDSNENASLTPPLTNPTDAISVVVDRTPPDIIVSAPTNGYVCNDGDNLVDGGNGGPCEVTFTVSVGSNVTSVTFGGVGIPASTTVTPVGGVASTTYTLTNGTSGSITATATDQFGNTNAVSVSVSADTTTPVITAVNSPTAGEIFTTQAVSFDVNTTGAEAGQDVIVTSSATTPPGQEIAHGAVDATGHAVFSTSSAPGGPQTLTFTIANLAGNVSAPVTVSINIEISGCQIDLSFPSTSPVTFNAAESSGGANPTVTITGTTPNCAGGLVTVSKTLSGGSATVLGTTNANGSPGNSFSYAVPFTNGETGSTITVAMTGNSVSFVASAQFTVPTLALTAPTPNGSNQVFLVAQNYNSFVEADAGGYIADATSAAGDQLNVGFTVTEIGGGNVTISIVDGGVLVPQAVTGSISQPFTEQITLNQGFVGPVTLTATDTAGNVTATSFSVAETDVLTPATPSPVTFNLLNQYHSDFNVLFPTPVTPDGVGLSGEVGCTTSLILGGGTAYTEAQFQNPALTTTVALASLPTDGGTATASYTDMPPFNSNLCYARVSRPSGNQSALPATASELDVDWAQDVIAFPGSSSNAAEFGEMIALGDINGDGKTDMVVQAPDDSNYTGSLTIYYGGPLPLTNTQRLAGPAQNTYFGQPFAVGDISGDGRADVIAYNTNHMEGYLASPDGGNLPTTPVFTVSDPNIFVATVALDLNDDGIPDLVLCDPFAGMGGTAYVFYGRGDWSATPALTTSDANAAIENNNASGQFCGFNQGLISVPDVDGDGYNELLIVDVNLRVAYFILGRTLTSVGTGSVTVFSPQIVSAPSTAGGGFGTVGATLDLTGNGKSDLLLGDDGAVYDALQGTSAQFPSTFTVFASGNDDFGGSVAVGDVNQDGTDDFLVGGFGANPGYLSFLYSKSGVVSSTVEGTVVGSDSAGDGFSNSVVVGDLDGDGKPEVIVGETGVGNGSVYIFH